MLSITGRCATGVIRFGALLTCTQMYHYKVLSITGICVTGVIRFGAPLTCSTQVYHHKVFSITGRRVTGNPLRCTTTVLHPSVPPPSVVDHRKTYHWGGPLRGITTVCVCVCSCMCVQLILVADHVPGMSLYTAEWSMYAKQAILMTEATNTRGRYT